MYSRMLVPLDGSELAQTVLPYAGQLAARLGTEVILFHVRSPHEGEVLPAHLQEVWKESEVVRGRSGAPLVGADRLATVRSEEVSGQPAEEILRYAEKNNIDLILIATHGRSGFKRWVMGSVAEKVTRAARMPVWLVRLQSQEPIVDDKGNVKAILVPLDGSRLAEAVLPHVKNVASELGAEVVLFHVLPSTYDVYTAGGRDAHVQYSKDLLEQAKASANG
ncbi:MAG: universal stress protein, partial [Chloroflexi bacterium]|nr:universal stress protein [Chloroflexota bacterium]